MIHHSAELAERWRTMPLVEQLANVGSEVSRMTKWRGRDDAIAERAFERMLELLDLTMACVPGPERLREIARAREQLVGAWLSDLPASDPEWDSLNRYFLYFAVLARKQQSA